MSRVKHNAGHAVRHRVKHQHFRGGRASDNLTPTPTCVVVFDVPVEDPLQDGQLLAHLEALSSTFTPDGTAAAAADHRRARTV